MNNDFKFLVKQGLKSCISKYMVTVLLAAVLFFISTIVSEPVHTLILNICGGLFSLPIIFLSYDVYQIIHTRKQREMVTKRLNDQIEAIFINFLFVVNKLRKNFDDTQDNLLFLEGRKSNLHDIFNDISSTRHYGFYIFSRFDNFCTEINEMLESPLLLYYAPNNIISLISEFSLCYEKLLDEFKMVSNDDFIRVGIDENLEFVISENIQSPYDTYNIFRNIDDNRHSIYVANYPLFDENMLKGLYRISGTKAEILAHQIFQLYSIVNRWERTCQNKLDVDKLMIASGRLCKKAYINFYSKNNISFDLQWS